MKSGLLLRLSWVPYRGPLTKRKKSYAKERCLLAEQSAKASHVERSTSITKRLVFQYPFCRKTSCNRIIERFLSRMIRGKAQAYDFFRFVSGLLKGQCWFAPIVGVRAIPLLEQCGHDAGLCPLGKGRKGVVSKYSILILPEPRWRWDTDWIWRELCGLRCRVAHRLERGSQSDGVVRVNRVRCSDAEASKR
jgi:hypothetical protein